MPSPSESASPGSVPSAASSLVGQAVAVVVGREDDQRPGAHLRQIGGDRIEQREQAADEDEQRQQRRDEPGAGRSQHGSGSR
jgi:hypothetical protein